MSVLIKGMEMPEVCADCPFRSTPELFMLEVNRYHYISQCTRASEEIEDPWRDTLWQLEHKESWCPLIEVPTPHGRLIDFDALERMDFSNWIMQGDVGYVPFMEVAAAIFNAPTIIEGEQEVTE